MSCNSKKKVLKCSREYYIPISTLILANQSQQWEFTLKTCPFKQSDQIRGLKAWE